MDKVKQLADELYNQKVLDGWKNVSMETCLKRATDYYRMDKVVKKLNIPDVGSSLPDLAECNQASLDYATKKYNSDFFLIKQTFKEGINWALNYMTKNK